MRFVWRCGFPLRSRLNLNGTTTRSISTRQYPQGDLLATLRRNPELDEEDAKNELRWIIQEARSPSLPPPGSPSRTKGGDADEVIRRMVERRAAGEPLQYILGCTDFGPLTLKCRAPVLIPRSETAFIYERYAQLIRDAIQTTSVPPTGRSVDGARGRQLEVLDLCTGSGCIPLLLSHLLPTHLSIPLAIDISAEAIEVARENSQFLDLPLDLLRADLFDRDFAERVVAKRGKMDVLISNPPYIPPGEYENLTPGVREFEDRRALLDDPHGDGLKFYRRIADLIPLLLRPLNSSETWAREVPKVVLEIGHTQATAVRRILEDHSRSKGRVMKTEVWKDQYGRDRAIAAWIV